MTVAARERGDRIGQRLGRSARPAMLERYAGGDAAARRMILAELLADLPALNAFDPAIPVLPNEIEWSARPANWQAR